MQKQRQGEYDNIVAMNGSENPYKLHDELGQVMTENVTVVRYNKQLEKTLVKISELQERMKNVGLADTGVWTNQAAVFTRNMTNMLVLAKTITKGALLRNESRGAHYKPDFPERDDANFLKSTIAEWKNGEPEISYTDVDTSLITPRLRNYAKDKATSKTGEKK